MLFLFEKKKSGKKEGGRTSFYLKAGGHFCLWNTSPFVPETKREEFESGKINLFILIPAAGDCSQRGVCRSGATASARKKKVVEPLEHGQRQNVP